MNKIALIIVVVVIVLIVRQLVPKKVDSFDLLGMPIMAIIRTYMGLPDTMSLNMIIELVCLLGLGAAIGYYQAKNTRVFRKEPGGKLCSVGGYTYLIGWFVLLIGRVIILALFNFSALSTAYHEGHDKFINEIVQVASRTGDWLVWSAIAASSILYTLTLYRAHPDIKQFIHTRLKEIKR